MTSILKKDEHQMPEHLMNHSRRIFLSSLAISLVKHPLSLTAAEPDPSKINLLKNESLEGWIATDFHLNGKCSVSSGVLRLDRGKPMTGVTCKLANLPKTNYELSYQARRVDGSDFFAAATFPVNDSFLTFVNGGWSGNITGLSSIDGSDASENETGRLVKFENETWYSFKVRVESEKIICHVNSEKVVDFDPTGRSLKTRVESRPSQPLGFACYDSIGEIRNIQISRF